MAIVKRAVQGKLKQALTQHRRDFHRWLNLEADELRYLIRLIDDDLRHSNKPTEG